MKRLAILITGVLIALGAYARKVDAPDFAFPQKVAEQSQSALKTAQKRGDGPATVRALINFSLAEMAIDPARLPSVVGKIRQTRAQERDSVTAAMTDLLLARILCDAYRSEAYNYNRRTLPPEPLPENPYEWSGAQFRDEIKRLTRNALDKASALKNVGVKQWKDVLTLDGSEAVYYPTLYDFAAQFTINVEQSISTIGNIVPLKALYEPIGDVKVANKDVRRILSLYDELIRYHADDPAPRINYTIKRLEFLKNHAYRDYRHGDSAALLANQELMKIYSENFPLTEFSGDALIMLDFYRLQPEQRDRLYNLTGVFMKKYPGYLNMADIEKLRKSLETKTLEILYPSPGEVIPSKKPVTIIVGAENVNDGFINIFRESEDSDEDEMIATFPVSVGDTIGSRGVVKIPFTFPEDGEYYLSEGVKNGEIDYHRNVNVVAASILLAAAESSSGLALYALDPIDGKPLPGVGVFKNTAKNGCDRLGVTDKNGKLDVKKSGMYYCALGDSISPEIFGYLSDNEGIERKHARISTSLPIYHPGDSVEWMVVVYKYGNVSNTLCTDELLTVKLCDTDQEDIETVELTTDSLGRVSGKFKLPENGMPGKYYIEVWCPDRIDFRWVEVADYKLPTFFIETDPAVFDGGDALLRGCVRAYSGFNLADATVSVSVKACGSRWWERIGGTPFYSAEVTTDSSGRFSLVLPAELMEGSPQPGGMFEADYTVTSASGESHEASVLFSKRPMVRLDADLNRDIDISKPFSFGVKVTDAEEKPIDAKLRYELLQNDTIVAAGRFMASDQKLDFSGLKQGLYKISIYTEDTPSDYISGPIVLYDPRVKASPLTNTVLWTPSPKFEVNSTGRGKIMLAASDPTHVFYTLKSGCKVVDQRIIPFEAGKDSVEIVLPDGVEQGIATFAAVADYTQSDISVAVTAPAARRKLRIKAESMRDKVVPGAPETWTIKVEPTGGTPEAAAVILDMYNSSIDALASDDLKLYLPGKHFMTFKWELEFPRLQMEKCSFGNFMKFLTESHGWFWCDPIKNPEFKFEVNGRTFNTLPAFVDELSSYAVAGYGANTYRSRRSVASSFDFDSDEEMVEDAVVIPDGDSVAKQDGGQQGGGQQGGEPAFAYRDSEVPLAFFRPMLTTADDGRLTFSFTVPNANTTWSFNAMAYTRDLLSAHFQADVIAAKPVMVQPNLPRFVRSGDRVEIPAIVMNNTDSRADITTVIEIFDAATGAVLTTERHTDAIGAMGSATVSIMIDVPLDAPQIGYRVKSQTEEFADGEQTLLPVLAASQPVVTTKPFFIPAGEKDFSMELPQISGDARVTLEYCENPAWFVVTALPGLYDNKFNTTLGAAHSLFAAAVADGIVRKYPAVSSAIARWTASDRSDSILVSMLERNADLKIALLQATPWMMDARSDSERMDRLALILDRRMIDNTISDAVGLLGQRQKQGGGWGWLESYDKADFWTTMIVLRMMGRLNVLGFIPKNDRLDAMIRNAVEYIDASVAESYRRSPGGNYMEYVYMRDMFPDIRQSSAAGRVTSATVQQLVGHWADLAPQAKGAAATILYRHNYAATSRNILESLREYAVTSPGQGMWWPSLREDWWSLSAASITGYILEAFATVEPGCADVEKICHWLVNQKAAQDWGDEISTASLVATFLAVTPKWIAPAVPTAVTIGAEPVTPPSVERTTGYFRTDITRLHPSGERLSIAGGGATPSWGAVYINDVQQLTAIEPAKTDGLEISKSYIVVGADGSARVAAGRLHTGDRVRVTLTIKADRTMDYVAIIDNRAACFEPVDQIPGYVYADGLGFYRVNADTATSLFINCLHKGIYVLSYDMWVNNAGVFSAGAATIQSQYAPSLTARTSGARFTVE